MHGGVGDAGQVGALGTLCTRSGAVDEVGGDGCSCAVVLYVGEGLAVCGDLLAEWRIWTIVVAELPSM